MASRVYLPSVTTMIFLVGLLAALITPYSMANDVSRKNDGVHFKHVGRLTPINGSGAGEISRSCLDCICQVESNNTCIPCRWDVSSLSCGPYQIKKDYHTDCYQQDRSVVSDWKTCATGSPGDSCTDLNKAKASTEKCIRAYMRRYAIRCTVGRQPTCEDYARIHNGGPMGCRSSSTYGYWRKVKACCDRTGRC